MNANKPVAYRVEYLCGGCNKAHAWGECTEEKELKNEPVAWTACLSCGQRVTGDSIHTCSPQLKTLTDEEINEVFSKTWLDLKDYKDFARAILRKAQEK